MIGKSKLDWSPVLLSTLVFPGAGQLKQKRYVRGVILLALGTIALVGFVVRFIKPFQQILLAHINLNGPPVAEQAESLWAAIAGWVLLLLLVWIVGAVDAYITMRRDPGPMGRLVLSKKSPEPPRRPDLPPPPTPKLS